MNGKFQKVLFDLQECYDNGEDYDMSIVEGLSAAELKARKRLISLCIDISQDFSDELGYLIELTVEDDEDYEEEEEDKDLLVKEHRRLKNLSELILS